MMNSHYIPKFILNKFSDKLCLYNIKTGEFKENIKLEKSFVVKGLYSDEIEKKLNFRLESQFSQLLVNKILKKDDGIIELSQAELKLVKNFF